MFVTRITGVVGATADDLSVTIRSQSGDGRALAELSAKHPFEEEIVLPVAAPAPVAIVIEVRGGGDVPIGFHALPWSDVSQRTCKGWALDEQLRAAKVDSTDDVKVFVTTTEPTDEIDTSEVIHVRV